MSGDPYAEFRRAVERPDNEIDLARAALAIALGEYPELDPGACLLHIHRIAAEVRGRIASGADVDCVLAALNYVLFEVHGFRGDRESYFDPRNSFLNDVLERRRGIPITLSVLYIEVAQRIGLPLYGVGFPGHFLVKYADRDREIVMDPFDGGAVRSRQELRNLLQRVSRGTEIFRPELLERASNRQIVRRMLANLRFIYLRREEWLKALAVLDRLVILNPDHPAHYRERGLLRLELECFGTAREDLETYLRLAPDAEDAPAVRDRLITLAKQVRIQ